MFFKKNTQEQTPLPTAPSPLKNPTPATPPQTFPAGQAAPPVQDIHAEQADNTNWKEIVIYSGVGLLVVGGTIFLATKFIRGLVANKEEQKSLDTDSEASFAKQIKLAFDNDGWWGTNEEALRAVLRRIPTKAFFRDVAASYKKLYNSALTKDMQDELTALEYEEMMMIIAVKPEREGDAPQLNYLAWAKRIHAAVNIYYGIFPGTDEDAIRAVILEIPTQSAFKKVQEAYKKEYGDELLTDLEGDLSSDDYKQTMNLIKQKPF